METIGFEIIVGGVLPPLIDLINKYITNSMARFWVSILICLIVGVILNLGQLDFQNVLQTGAIVFASAQTIYKTYWKESNVRTLVLEK